MHSHFLPSEHLPYNYSIDYLKLFRSTTSIPLVAVVDYNSSFSSEQSHQQQHQQQLYGPMTTSGLFGEEAVDWIGGKRWKNKTDIIRDLRIIEIAKQQQEGTTANSGKSRIEYSLVYGYKRWQIDWFDIHASY